MVPARFQRLTRFASVGVANTLIDLGVYAVLQPHLGIVPATIISTGCGMVFSFVANAFFTFGATRLTLKAAVQFFSLNAVNFWLLQPLVILGLDALIRPLVGDAYVSALLAKVGSMVVSMTLSFLVYDRFIWPRTSVGSAPDATRVR